MAMMVRIFFHYNRLKVKLNGNLYDIERYTDPLISFNKWCHIYVNIYACNNIKVYINGLERSLNDSSDTNTAYQIPTNPLTVGKSFMGKMDDVRVYDAALSSSQIKQNYIAGLESLLAKGLISEDEFKQRLAVF